MTAQPGGRTVSWLDEDDPNRGAVPFVPVESVIELAPSEAEPPPRKKSRREKAPKPPKPPKPPRGKLWRRDKATQEKPPRENPPRDVTPRADDWPAPASEEWLTTLRGPADRASRDAQARPEWATVPDEAPRNSGPHPAWAAAPEDALDDGWTTTPPLDQPPPASARTPSPAPAPGPASGLAGADAEGRDMSREDWFAPREGLVEGETPRGRADRPVWETAPEWDQPRAGRPTAADPGLDQRRGDWTAAPEAPGEQPADARWDQAGSVDPRWDQAAAPDASWDQAAASDPRWDEAAAPDARWDEAAAGSDRDAPVESAQRPDWVTSPRPAERPEWVTTPEPAARLEWDTEPATDHRAGRGAEPAPDHRVGWNTEPAPDHPGGWDAAPTQDHRAGWDTAPASDRRAGWDTAPEEKARPDWVTSPVPAAAPTAAPDGSWSAAEPQDAPVPEAWPAPLDITPDDDLAEQPAKQRRRGPRPPARTGGGPRVRNGRAGDRRKPLKLLAIALTAAVVVAAVVAAGTAYRLVLDGGGLSHTIAAPLGGRNQAELELESGAATVTVRGADLGGDLFQVTTPDGDDAVPRATIDGDRTTVRATSDSGEGASAVEVRLNSRVTWRLIFRGGAETQTVDLSGGRLAALEMEGGATRLELTLPKPAVTVPIRLRGGLEELLLHAPTGVPTRVKVTKGATNVTLDRLNRSKVAPDTTFTPNGWGDAKARYDVSASEGIGTVKLDRR
jgi:hypothetical protein